MGPHAASTDNATGEQFTISAGGSEATIASLAGALRSYRHRGTDLVEPFGADEVPPVGSGILLAPWGNRIRDGRWTLDGAVQQLDITEPSRGNAIHGLLRNTGYRALAHSAGSVSLAAEIHPQHGFPFRMRHTATYALDGDGHLTVTQELANLSARTAPAALGAHPFLRLGETPTADLVLTVAGSRRLVTDERMIPTGSAPVDGDDDFRAGRRLGGTRLDAALADLAPAGDGRYRHRIEDPAGRTLELWASPEFAYAQVFVTGRYRGRELAVAVEPMTAPADAYNSGEGLRWLEPGETLRAQWGLVACL